jgi:hypothetical protein
MVMAERSKAGKFLPGNTAARKARKKPSTALKAVASKEELDQVVRNIVDLALQGDKESAFWVASRVAPAAKPILQPVNIDVDLSSTDSAVRGILAATMSAQVDPSTAESLVRTVAAATNITQLQAMAQRLTELEERLPAVDGPKDIPSTITHAESIDPVANTEPATWLKAVLEGDND